MTPVAKAEWQELFGTESDADNPIPQTTSTISKTELEELFGEDSDAEDNLQTPSVSCAVTPTTFPDIPGLSIAYGALPLDLRQHLLQNISKEQWFDPSNARDQVMRFGTLPSWLHPLLDIGASLLPDHLKARTLQFDQLIANYYTPGQGLSYHVDLLNRFEDGIIVASIFGSCVMEFRPAAHIRDLSNPLIPTTPVLLSAGDVVCLHGPARWDWEHGIPSRTEDDWEGKIGINNSEKIEA
ncbi:hypothetical protein HK097_000702 [Rhizophlyctis rosea]|uniref:Fe2OG dioxygenase domain-containing protein n=1 Tax=Rhizophlyctis rosea TaxID=64517 RepID=A0AAD5X7L3_9FUNG|nr:hypothetical protein HK097_000702 [Rhizophlyctis rosea]